MFDELTVSISSPYHGISSVEWSSFGWILPDVSIAIAVAAAFRFSLTSPLFQSYFSSETFPQNRIIKDNWSRFSTGQMLFQSYSNNSDTVTCWREFNKILSIKKNHPLNLISQFSNCLLREWMLQPLCWLSKTSIHHLEERNNPTKDRIINCKMFHKNHRPKKG